MLLEADRASVEVYEQSLAGLTRRVAELECELRAMRDALHGLQQNRGHLFSQVGPETNSARDRWQVTMFGRFRVERNGTQPPNCPSRRGRSILKYLLASRGHMQLQPVLIETFWPGAPAGTGAHNLQMAVHALRHSLTGWGPRGGDDAILFREERYLLHPELAIDQDVDRYRQAYASGERAFSSGDLETARRAFEAARSVYAGEFLSDSPYDDWAADERAALQDMQLSLLGHLARLYATAADPEAAAACCREILAVDPYREDACRELMRCEAARGRRGEVRTLFESLVRRLRLELQVAPAAETRRLYMTLMGGESDG